MTMTEFEIVQMYRQAKYKEQQIPILAQLNLCSTDEIRDILIRHGEPVKKKVRYFGLTQEQKQMLIDLYRSDLPYGEISAQTGLSYYKVAKYSHELMQAGVLEQRQKEKPVTAGGRA